MLVVSSWEGKAPNAPSEEASAVWAKSLPVRRLSKETPEGEAGLSEAVCLFGAQVAPEPALSRPWRGRGITEGGGPWSPGGQGLGLAGPGWGGGGARGEGGPRRRDRGFGPMRVDEYWGVGVGHLGGLRGRAGSWRWVGGGRGGSRHAQLV